MGETPVLDRPATVSRTDAELRVLNAVRVSLEPLGAEALAQFAEKLEQVNRSAPTPPEKTELVRSITGRKYSEQERTEIEQLALLQYFRLRHELLTDALTTPQVATLLGTSRQTPHDRVKSGSLLAVSDRGALRFPPWQFDPASDDGVLVGLPEVVRNLQLPPLSRISWMVGPNAFLEGQHRLSH
jgi:hypothetical protein